MKNFIRKKREKLLENPWYSLYLDDIQTKSGSHFPEYYMLEFSEESAGVLILNEKNDMLFVEQYRYSMDDVSLEIPAGSIEGDEEPAEAAIRECLEETGFQIVLQQKHYSYFPSNSVSNQVFHLFTGKIIEGSCQNVYDTSEICSVRWLTQDQVKEKIKRNEIRDGLSLSALSLYFLGVFEN